MAASDLAVLPDVKAWLQAGAPAFTTADDAVISRLITSVSGMICSYLSRSAIVPRSIVERYDGLASARILLKNYPVLAVTQVLADGVVLAAGSYPNASAPGWPPSGYLFSPWDGLPPGKPQVLDAFGSSVTGVGYSGFCRGRQNVGVTYVAGYQVSSESATVPASGVFKIEVQAPFGPWASDSGVVYAATGAALAAVASSPAAGQYVAPLAGGQDESAGASYAFAAADASAGVLISYGYVPAALNNACIEWVAERYRYRGRIGQKAQTVSSQQTASYDVSGMTDSVKTMLNPYRNVVPSMAWS